MGEGLQRIEFQTADFAAAERFEAWRSNVVDLFDVTPLDEDRPAPFVGQFRSHQAAGLLLISAAFDGQHFRRDPATVARSGLDHYFVQLYCRGGYRGTVGRREVVMRAGDIEILDLSQPLRTQASAASTIAVVIPRPFLDGHLGDGTDLHGLVLRGEAGLTALLADHLCTLARLADRIWTNEAPDVAHATLDMIAACVRPSAEALERIGPQMATAQLRAIKRYIDDNLGAPDLSAETLCARFRISRSSLYRLFESLDGVARYVQERRLSRAFVALSDGTNGHRRISDIAFDCGFTSEAHFSRAFRHAFGVSPRDVRPSRHAVPAARGRGQAMPLDSELGRWLRDIQDAAPMYRVHSHAAGH